MTTTQHFEVHIIATTADADHASLAGLPEIPYDMTACANCESDIGRTPTVKAHFIPLAIVLGEDDEGHLLCLRCTAPIFEHSV